MNRGIDEELRELGSRLAGLPRRNPFQLQPDYLAGLPGALSACVKRDSTVDPEPDFSRVMPFQTPEGYLEALPESLLNAAKTFGEDSKTLPYTVPADYFSGLPARLLESATASEEPVLKQTSRPFPVLRRSMPWIAAAAVVSALWFGLGRDAGSPDAELRAETALAQLGSDSIGAYVERNVDEFDTDILESSLAGSQITDFRKAVSELRRDEIENYLNDADADAEAQEDI